MKAPVKIMIPIVLFIFPVLFIILMGLGNQHHGHDIVGGNMKGQDFLVQGIEVGSKSMWQTASSLGFGV